MHLTHAVISLAALTAVKALPTGGDGTCGSGTRCSDDLTKTHLNDKSQGVSFLPKYNTPSASLC